MSKKFLKVLRDKVTQYQPNKAKVVFLQFLFIVESQSPQFNLIHTRKIFWLLVVEKSSFKIFHKISSNQMRLSQVYLTIIMDRGSLLSVGTGLCNISWLVLVRMGRLWFGTWKLTSLYFSSLSHLRPLILLEELKTTLITLKEVEWTSRPNLKREIKRLKVEKLALFGALISQHSS